MLWCCRRTATGLLCRGTFFSGLGCRREVSRIPFRKLGFRKPTNQSSKSVPCWWLSKGLHNPEFRLTNKFFIRALNAWPIRNLKPWDIRLFRIGYFQALSLCTHIQGHASNSRQERLGQHRIWPFFQEIS